MKATEFVIDRSRWACGKPPGGRTNQLLDREGRMCCLGFYAAACGVPSIELADRDSYDDVDIETVKRHLPVHLVHIRNGNEIGEIDEIWTSTLHEALVDENDDGQINAQRETKIAELFATMGVTVTFTGEYP